MTRRLWKAGMTAARIPTRQCSLDRLAVYGHCPLHSLRRNTFLGASYVGGRVGAVGLALRAMKRRDPSPFLRAPVAGSIIGGVTSAP